MNTPAINSVLAKRYKPPANATHRYTPQLVFIMDVRIDNNKLNKRIWVAGPDPDPCADCPDDSDTPETPGSYGAAWRSVNFPSTLAPVMYGRLIHPGMSNLESPPRLHSTHIHHDAKVWFNSIIKAEDIANKRLDERPLDTFTIERAEIQLFDNQGKPDTFGQLAIYISAETKYIGRIQDIFRIITRERPSASEARSRVPGGYLYDLLDSEAFRSESGGTGLTDGIHFYDNKTYLQDTEAKIYSVAHLRIAENTCAETIEYVAESNGAKSLSIEDSWKVYLAYLATSIPLHQFITNDKTRDRQLRRIKSIVPGRSYIITRLGAAYLTLDNPSYATANSELYFLAEHVDAIMIARLHDQILRSAEVDLVTGMGNSSQLRSFDHISQEVLNTYHQFTADSVRYWMDDVIANSGTGMNSLHDYKVAIKYQERYDAMRTKIEDIAALAQQDARKALQATQAAAQQEAAARDEAHRRLSNKQQNIFLILTIISAIAIPASLFNDGLDVTQKILEGDYAWNQSWKMLFILLFAVVIGIFAYYTHRSKDVDKPKRRWWMVWRCRSDEHAKK